MRRRRAPAHPSHREMRLQELYVETLMSRRVEAVPPDTELASVWNRMRVNELVCVVVVEQERAVGTISERNLVSLLDDVTSHSRAMPTRARDIMTAPPISVGPRETVERALELMSATGVTELVVAESGGPLLGAVSTEALLRGQLQRVDMERTLLEGDLAERTRELVEANLRLRNESLEDHLLGIANRRAMNADLEQIHELARRFRRPYAALLFDVDQFKPYNDRYGHPAGDRVLQQVASVLGDAVRKVDRLYRYGGEEILAVLPETGEGGAITVAERARDGVQALGIPHAGSAHHVLTVSCGVAISGQGGLHPRSWQVVVNAADEQLYHAKEDGRNLVRSVVLEVDPSDDPREIEPPHRS